MPDSQDAARTRDDVKISLVVATLGRRDELARLLESLQCQTRRPHQVIIVDQNPAGWLDETLSAHSGGLPLLHLHSAKGLSRARNVGVASVTGDIIGFPDDDCWLQPDLLARVIAHFSSLPNLAVACLPLHDETDRPIMLRWPTTRIQITRRNVWRTCMAAGVFARRSIMETTYGFDESIGVGSSTGLASGEETDLVLRLVSAGHRIEFAPITGLHHPARPPAAALAGRAEAYGRGFGYVWTRHHLPSVEFYYYCMRALGGYLLARIKSEQGAARYYSASIKGRLDGRRAALKTRA